MCPHDPQRDSGENDQRLPDEDVGIVEVLGHENADVKERYDAYQIDELNCEQAANNPDQFGRNSGREGEYTGNENQAGDQPIAAVVNGDRKARRRDHTAGDCGRFTEDAEDEARHLSNDGSVGCDEDVVDLPQRHNGEAHAEDCKEQDEETSLWLLPQFAEVHTSQSDSGMTWDVRGTKPPDQRTAHRYLRSGFREPFQGTAE